VDEAVTERMAEVQRSLYANAASVHGPGVRAARAVEVARARVAAGLGCDPDEVRFTSGGTESNNLALKGAVWAAPPGDRHLVVSAIEHPSVLEAAAWLEDTGQARVTRVPPDGDGRVRAGDVAGALEPRTVLVSVMHVNNETGAIQPLAEIGRVCRDRGVLFHSDACQGFLKAPLAPRAWGLDLVTLNAHKVHGPKGVGALWVREGVRIAPLLHGGGHEAGLRSGTVNVPGIAGFGEAVARYGETDVARMRVLKSRLVEGLARAFPALRWNGPPDLTACAVVNFSLPGHTGKWLFQQLDRRGIHVSPSSACHSTKLTPSHVLLAMGRTDEEANAALRVSIGRFTTADDVDRLLAALAEVAPEAEGGA